MVYPSFQEKNVSGRKRRTNTKCTLTEVESGSMITPMWTRKYYNWYQFLSVSHTYTRKSLWWSSVTMVAQNLMQLLVSFNNVGKDSQICKCNKKTNSKIWYMETHTQIDKWGRATKEMSQNVESTKMLLLHNTRETLA